ncbi:phosphotransferase family protein [Pseudomonas sp. Teo4]|uniref:phosphotransferase family protein n=1 Tax=Pseudomonas sp. Teo4 TaxID=3064528 RepID=UPI002AB9CEC4|nr:phosphotransferase family protein [Pseudomonas sp. Teo4]MDZ3993517.1 putative aminoglycoside phosphotransferase [Pseudomonas sp. Teo4]
MASLLHPQQIQQALSAWLSQLLDQPVVIEHSERLSGGAIQENWLLQGRVNHTPQRWVLRTDAASVVAASMSREQEFAVLSIAHQAGVKVPEPLWLCLDRSVIGREFFIMQALGGTASGHHLTRAPNLPEGRPNLCEQLGANLARLHRVIPPQPALAFLPQPAADPALASIEQYRRFLDALPGAHPVLEWGLRWCEENRPTPLPPRLIHRDYRTGNYLVDGSELTGVLDWEFAGWGDPREDLGWFTARCWRFSRPDLEAGGIGRLEDMLAGYHSVSALELDGESLAFWQVMAHLRWAVIALQQAERHVSGQQRSLELALTGRMVAELEQEILLLTRGEHL